jgi:Uma2 family endonuclease
MAMSERVARKLTEAEFFDWLVRQERRHELVNGEVFMMAGADRRHDRIVVNTIIALGLQLRGKRCRANSADTAVRIPRGNIRFPDVSVDCGQPDERSMVAAEPTVVIEVLSPSTRAFDREDKLEEYKTVESLRHILLIDPDEPAARIYTRDGGAGWATAPVEGLEAAIELPAVSAILKMADVYDAVVFTPRPRLVVEG